MILISKSTAVFPSPAHLRRAVLALCAAAMMITGCGGGGEDVRTASIAAPSATVQKTSLETAALVAPVAAPEAGSTSVAGTNPDLCE